MLHEVDKGIRAVGRAGRVRIEQHRLAQDQVRGLKRPRRLLGERTGDVVVLPLGERQGFLAIVQGIEESRQRHGGTHRGHDQHQTQPQRTAPVACAVRGLRRRRERRSQ